MLHFRWIALHSLLFLVVFNSICFGDFHVYLNGLQCFDKTESDDDDIYLDVSLDGKVLRYPNKGEVGMSPSGSKRFWMTGFNWNVKKSISIFVWDKDGGLRGKDDHIGTITINEKTVEGESSNTLTGSNTKYVIRYSKETRPERDRRVPQDFSIFDKKYNLLSDPVGDQENTSACVAYSTSAALGTHFVRQYLKVNLSGKPSPDLSKFSKASMNMFDAAALYELRSKQYDTLVKTYGSYPKPGSKEWNNTGWNFPLALELAKTQTVPFKYGDKNFGVRVKSWGKIFKTGKVFENSTLSSNGTEIKANRFTGVSEMRRLLAMGLPLLADYDVYEDFSVFPKGPGGIYYGRIGEKRTGGHAVMIVGYNDPGPKTPGATYWEVQNSWGKNWGNGGFFNIKAGAVSIDDVMYYIQDYYLCDLNGKAVSQAEGIRLLNSAIDSISK
ncbi:MAG: C1 family peptidase [Zavarzinella sp.]